MTIDFSALPPKDIYHAMIQCVVPRPVAWVLSDNGDGSLNLAPFSYFNGVTSRPPIISISAGEKPDGSKKDTWRNIEERKEFIVHIASTDDASLVTATAAGLAQGESEIDANGIELAEEAAFPLPRVRSAKIAMHCQLHRIVEVGEGPQALILGEIKGVWIDDAIVSQDEKNGLTIDALKLDPLARLGGDDYASLGRTWTVPRP